MYKCISRCFTFVAISFMLIILISMNTVHKIVPFLSLTQRHLSFGSECENETMAYKIGNLTGKPFDCSLVSVLKELELLRDQTANSVYYNSVRATIRSIQQNFQNYHIVLYDLGGVAVNETWVNEINAVCGLEFRTFDWKKLPYIPGAQKLRDLKIYAWKVYIIAKSLLEFEEFIYADSSIRFTSGSFDEYFDAMGNGLNNSLVPFQMSGNSGHSIQHATDPGMLQYLPLQSELRKTTMFEANLLLVRKSQSIRQLLKWSILCALTRECIEPYDAKRNCLPEGMTDPGQCHRQDQSMFNILLANLEFEESRHRPNLISHNSPLHPKSFKQRHETKRSQFTDENIADCSTK